MIVSKMENGSVLIELSMQEVFQLHRLIVSGRASFRAIAEKAARDPDFSPNGAHALEIAVFGDDLGSKLARVHA